MNPIRIRVAATSLLVGVVAPVAACAPEPPPPTTTTTTTAAPAEVAITASLPSSPSASMTPRLVGFAPAATTTVRVFASVGCTGPTVAFGDLATFSSTGIAVEVAPGSTTEFSVNASGPGLSICSAPFTYVNTLTPPAE